MSRPTASESPWWTGGGDLYKSHWAEKNDIDTSSKSGSFPKKKEVTRGKARVPVSSKSKHGLSPPLVRATPYRVAGIPVIHPYSKPLASAALENRKNLTIKTDLVAKERPKYDDSSDVIMGGSTPIEMQPCLLFTDADGDILMHDLDDAGATGEVVHIIEGERQGGQYLPGPPSVSISPNRVGFVEYVLVVDTNFILTHLQLVNNLVDAYHRWGSIVMLPWATIMELDGLKKSTSTIKCDGVGRRGIGDVVSIGSLARRANNWAFQKLRGNEKGLWGQMKEETLDESAIMGDEAILDCCRFIKETKGFETALLSNDKNLCVKALVYGIKTISFSGTPFTADGILSFLQGSKCGTNPYHPPGIWSSIDEAKKYMPELAAIFDSRYPWGASTGTTYTKGKPLSPIHIRHSDLPENILNPKTDWEVRAAVGFLLLRVELDIETSIPVLLYQHWTKIKTDEQDPGVGPFGSIRGIEGVETHLTIILKDSFSEFFPDGLDLWCKLISNDFSYEWKGWCKWTLGADERGEALAKKPSPNELLEWIDSWMSIWSKLLVMSDDRSRDYQRHLVATGTWKAMAKSLVSHLKN